MLEKTKETIAQHEYKDYVRSLVTHCSRMQSHKFVTYLLHVYHSWPHTSRHISYFTDEKVAEKCAQALSTFYTDKYNGYLPFIEVTPTLWCIVDRLAFSNTGVSVRAESLLTMLVHNDALAAKLEFDDIPQHMFGEAAWVETPKKSWRKYLTCCLCCKDVPSKYHKLPYSVQSLEDM